MEIYGNGNSKKMVEFQDGTQKFMKITIAATGIVATEIKPQKTDKWKEEDINTFLPTVGEAIYALIGASHKEPLESRLKRALESDNEGWKDDEELVQFILNLPCRSFQSWQPIRVLKEYKIEGTIFYSTFSSPHLLFTSEIDLYTQAENDKRAYQSRCTDIQRETDVPYEVVLAFKGQKKAIVAFKESLAEATRLPLNCFFLSNIKSFDRTHVRVGLKHYQIAFGDIDPLKISKYVLELLEPERQEQA